MFVTIGSDLAALIGGLQQELEMAQRRMQNVVSYANRLARENSELAREVEGCMEGINSRDEEIEDLYTQTQQQDKVIKVLEETTTKLSDRLDVLELEQLVIGSKAFLSQGDYERLLAKASVVRGLVSEIQECLNKTNTAN